MTTPNWTLILDFDSTVVQVESLDVLAEISLKDHPEKASRISQIKSLTHQGMSGEITFQDSLQKRLALLEGKKKHVVELSQSLVQSISHSFKNKLDWIKSHAKHIQIFSGGFREAIFPCTDLLGIPQNHIHANDFIYSESGNIVGVDEDNPFSRSGGKVFHAKLMELAGEIVMVGDGNTDAEMKLLGNHVNFLAFTENIKRTTVIEKADKVVESFDDVIRFLDKMD
jgi:D-3-phosphoglycerate dehydrogenase